MCPLLIVLQCRQLFLKGRKDSPRGHAGLYCGTFSVSRCPVLSSRLPQFCVQQEGIGLTGRQASIAIYIYC